MTDEEPDGDAGADVAIGDRENVDATLSDGDAVDEREERGLTVAEWEPEGVLDSRTLVVNETEPLIDVDSLADRLEIIDADAEPVCVTGAEVAMGDRENEESPLLDVDAI